MLKKVGFVMIGILFLLSSPDLAEAQPWRGIEGKTEPIKPRIEVPDQPRIMEFSVTPQITVPGESVVFRWRVEPGLRGSPITQVTIAAGLAVFYRGNDLSGERSVPIGNPGRVPVSLVVENQVGKRATQSIPFEVISLDSLKSKLSLQEISTRPSPVVGDNASFSFNIKINNQSGARLNNIQIRVIQTNDRSGGTGTVIADQGGLMLTSGLSIYNLKSNGFDSSYGSQLFVTVLHGTTMPKEKLKSFSVNLRIAPVTINSYTVGAYEPLI
jgi:hypothetical protein